MKTINYLYAIAACVMMLCSSGTETIGDRIFVEQVNEREMTLRIEFADRDHSGARKSFVVSTPSEQASAVTFGSSEEVFEYVKKHI